MTEMRWPLAWLLLPLFSGCTSPPGLETYFLDADAAPPGMTSTVDAINQTVSLRVDCTDGKPLQLGCMLLGPAYPEGIRFQELNSRDWTAVVSVLVAPFPEDRAEFQESAIKQALVPRECEPGMRGFIALRDGGVLVLVGEATVTSRQPALDVVAALQAQSPGLRQFASGCAPTA